MSNKKAVNGGGNVVQHPATKAGAKARIKPPEGWQVQTNYGTLKTRNSVDLVRLEDIHAWLLTQGTPANDAVYKIFNPFYQGCLNIEEGNTDDAALIGAIHALNALTYPDGLYKSDALSELQSVHFFAGCFPKLGHVRFSDGSIGALVYSMGEGALRIWRGGADIGTDHLAVLQDGKDRKVDVDYSILWPKDDDLRKLLGRLAVPIQTAYELWGYGHIAEVPALVLAKLPALQGRESVVDLLASSPINEIKTPTTWHELVAFRKAHTRASWTPSMKTILKKEEENRKIRPASKGVRMAIAKELGVSDKRVGDLIRELAIPQKNVRMTGTH